MTIQVHIQQASEAADIPVEADFQRWIAAALEGRRDSGEISIRIIELEEMQALNFLYRQQNKATNVLSFPMGELPGIEDEIPMLGDIVLCAPVIATEASQQSKLPEAHWAHMVVHSILHLLGYDHEEDDEAQAMEALERQIMDTLDYPDPYGEIDDREAP